MEDGFTACVYVNEFLPPPVVLSRLLGGEVAFSPWTKVFLPCVLTAVMKLKCTEFTYVISIDVRRIIY